MPDPALPQYAMEIERDPYGRGLLVVEREASDGLWMKADDVDAHLRAVEAAHQQAIAGLKAELKDVTNAAEDWFKLLQESRSDRERLANESWAAERVAHAITTVELEAAEARLHALEAEPGAR